MRRTHWNSNDMFDAFEKCCKRLRLNCMFDACEMCSKTPYWIACNAFQTHFKHIANTLQTHCKRLQTHKNRMTHISNCKTITLLFRHILSTMQTQTITLVFPQMSYDFGVVLNAWNVFEICYRWFWCVWNAFAMYLECVCNVLKMCCKYVMYFEISVRNSKFGVIQMLMCFIWNHVNIHWKHTIELKSNRVFWNTFQTHQTCNSIAVFCNTFQTRQTYHLNFSVSVASHSFVGHNFGPLD